MPTDNRWDLIQGLKG